ncbi:MAG: phospholipase D family protein [Chromatiales bacterium]|nr:phospholipase D family protein [Chromatiales bacterium]
MNSIAPAAVIAMSLLATTNVSAAPDGGLRQATTALAAAHPGQSGVLLLDTGVEALRQRDALIEAATQTIDAQYYIWNPDASGRYLAARLLAAAARGVHVRVILDDINAAGRDAAMAGLAAHPNVEIRIYNPTAARGGFLRTLGFIRDFSRVNRRMHNKSFTADGAVTIVGGRNVGDEYFDLDPETNFRDRELLAVGPVVNEVNAGFEAFWNSTWTRPVESLATVDGEPDLFEELSAATGAVTAQGYEVPDGLSGLVATETLPALLWAPARLVFDTPPTAEEIDDSDAQQRVALELRQLVAGTRREILVESAYFILGDQSLAEAARLHEAGVDLRVLTNSLASNDLVTNHSGYARRRPAMLDAGIELFELRPDAAACRRLVRVSRACENGPAFSLHAKSMVLDRSVVYIGSFNLNLRSTYLNSETALIVESPELAQRVAASMEELFRPDSSWRVLRGKGGGLEWVTEVDGREVRETHEPMTSFGRRFNSGFYRLFPLEKYL